MSVKIFQNLHDYSKTTLGVDFLYSPLYILVRINIMRNTYEKNYKNKWSYWQNCKNGRRTKCSWGKLLDFLSTKSTRTNVEERKQNEVERQLLTPHVFWVSYALRGSVMGLQLRGKLQEF